MVIFTVVLFFAIKFTFSKFQETFVSNFPMQVSPGGGFNGMEVGVGGRVVLYRQFRPPTGPPAAAARRVFAQYEG